MTENDFLLFVNYGNSSKLPILEDDYIIIARDIICSNCNAHSIFKPFVQYKNKIFCINCWVDVSGHSISISYIEKLNQISNTVRNTNLIYNL